MSQAYPESNPDEAVPGEGTENRDEAGVAAAALTDPDGSEASAATWVALNEPGKPDGEVDTRVT
jgi:hypothetical protein